MSDLTPARKEERGIAEGYLLACVDCIGGKLDAAMMLKILPEEDRASWQSILDEACNQNAKRGVAVALGDRMGAFRAVSDEETERIDDSVKRGRVTVTWREFFDVAFRGFMRDWPALSFLTVVWVTLAMAGFSADVRLFGFAVPFAVAWGFLLGWNSADEARRVYEKKWGADSAPGA